MNTFHSNIIENQPAQKLTRESWSRLPPNAGKGCATETAKNMRAPTTGYSQARSPATTRGVNASLCVEQGPESGVSRIGKRRREGVSRGVTYSLRTASPSANTANCGRMRLPSRSAFSRRRWNGRGSNGSFPVTGMLLTRILRGTSARTGQVRGRGNGSSVFQPSAIHMPGRTTVRTAARR
jgi:hypothetical protein